MLIDCDNFFVSCERVFNPSLRGKAVVVLSNNDGCVVARSNEAKAIGVGMAVPFYKVDSLLKNHKGVAISSNYELYSDLSKRIMKRIHQINNKMEIYSIDEAFIQKDISETDTIYFAKYLRSEILKTTGISVSIGIAKTKTLCKIASKIAKKNNHVFQINEDNINEILLDTKVEDIWGVGPNTAKKLKFMGIFTAFDLKKAQMKQIRGKLSINVEKTLLELQSISCLQIEDVTNNKSISSSRTFGKEIISLSSLEEATSEYCFTAAKKLRTQNSKASGIQVYVRTNPYKDNLPQYYNSTTVFFDEKTNNTSKIISAAKKGLKSIYKPGYHYKKCGVSLVNIEDNDKIQEDIFTKTSNNEKEDKLLNAIDEINNVMGNKTLFYAAQGINPEWKMRRAKRTGSYTTCWNELAKLKV